MGMSWINSGGQLSLGFGVSLADCAEYRSMPGSRFSLWVTNLRLQEEQWGV